MYTRFNLFGFLVSTLIQILGLYGVITVNLFCIFYWNYEKEPGNRLIWHIPLGPIPTMLFLTINTLAYIAFVSHIRWGSSDPGVMTDEIKPPTIVPKKEVRDWYKWGIDWKPFRAHHCSVWKACIFKMDHHWPWTNNCIGLKNMKYFFLFWLYSSIGGILSLLLHFFAFYKYCYDTETDYSTFSYYYTIWGWFLFDIFGSIMFPAICIPLIRSQWEVFEYNQTYIEDLKNLYGKPYGIMTGLNVHLGQDRLWWWLPTKPVLCINYWERSYTEREIETRIFKQYTLYEFDPQEKLKAKEWQESRKDRSIFIIFTLLLTAVAYTFKFRYFST